MKNIFLFVVSAMLLCAMQSFAQGSFSAYYYGGGWYMQRAAGYSAQGTLWYNTDNSTLMVLGNDSTWRGSIRNQTVAGDLAGTLPNPTIAAITNFVVNVDTLRTLSFTVPTTHNIFPISTAGAAVTATLPDATTVTGRIYTFIVRTGTNKIFIAPSASQKINGGGTDSSLTGTAYKSVTLLATDSSWNTIASH